VLDVGCRVLVVDDDPAIRRLVETILRLGGYAVTTVGDGGEALGLVAQWHPDVLILDLDLPTMAGQQVARALRQTGTTIPILVVSGGRQARDQATAIGAAAFVSKPFLPDALLTAVTQLCAAVWSQEAAGCHATSRQS
jgi:CheY-like chemotaxis protein